jgi:hypothetical protein
VPPHRSTGIFRWCSRKFGHALGLFAKVLRHKNPYRNTVREVISAQQQGNLYERKGILSWTNALIQLASVKRLITKDIAAPTAAESSR